VRAYDRAVSRKLSDFDRDTLNVAIKLAREHDPTLTEGDAQPVFVGDIPRITEEATGDRLSGLQLNLLRLSGGLPQARGRVAGEDFWLHRDVVRWAAARKARPEG
jgi:hypothetical protein